MDDMDNKVNFSFHQRLMRVAIIKDRNLKKKCIAPTVFQPNVTWGRYLSPLLSLPDADGV